METFLAQILNFILSRRCVILALQSWHFNSTRQPVLPEDTVSDQPSRIWQTETRPSSCSLHSPDVLTADRWISEDFWRHTLVHGVHVAPEEDEEDRLITSFIFPHFRSAMASPRTRRVLAELRPKEDNNVRETGGRHKTIKLGNMWTWPFEYEGRFSLTLPWRQSIKFEHDS